MKGGSQTTTMQVDPRTQQYVEQMRRAALGAQSNPIYAQASQAGQLGIGALTGGSNPFYDASRAQALNPIFDQARQRALGAVGSQATLQSAYGGSRHGVAEGQALGDIANQQTGLEYQDYLNSLQRAFGVANLGFGADAQRLGLLQGSVGPYGTTQTTQTQSDPFSQILGLGVTGLGLASGLGWAPLAAGAGSAFAPQNFAFPGGFGPGLLR